MSIAELKKGVSKLSSKDRAEFAHWIIFNLDTGGENEDMIEAAWREEIRGRVEDIKAGRVKMIPSGEMWKYF